MSGDDPQISSSKKKIFHEVDYDTTSRRPTFHCASCKFGTKIQQRFKLHVRLAHKARIGGYKIKKSPESEPIFSCAKCGFVSTVRDKLEDHLETCRGKLHKKRYSQEVIRIEGIEGNEKGADQNVETKKKSGEVVKVCDVEDCKSHLGCLPQWEKDYIYSQVTVEMCPLQQVADSTGFDVALISEVIKEEVDNVLAASRERNSKRRLINGPLKRKGSEEKISKQAKKMKATEGARSISEDAVGIRCGSCNGCLAMEKFGFKSNKRCLKLTKEFAGDSESFRVRSDMEGDISKQPVSAIDVLVDQPKDKTKKIKAAEGARSISEDARGIRCGSCSGCLAKENCGKCWYCYDKFGFGSNQGSYIGPNKRCMGRVCVKLNKEFSESFRVRNDLEGDMSKQPVYAIDCYEAKDKKESINPSQGRGGGHGMQWPWDADAVAVRMKYGCGSCTGCLTKKNCGKCRFCEDKPQFGGANTLKKKCEGRVCVKYPNKLSKEGGGVQDRKDEEGEGSSFGSVEDPRLQSEIEYHTVNREEEKESREREAKELAEKQRLKNMSGAEYFRQRQEEQMQSEENKSKDKDNLRKKYFCGSCDGCLTREDCGKCKFCEDKPIFGGLDLLRKECVKRACFKSNKEHAVLIEDASASEYLDKDGGGFKCPLCEVRTSSWFGLLRHLKGKMHKKHEANKTSDVASVAEVKTDATPDVESAANLSQNDSGYQEAIDEHDPLSIDGVVADVVEAPETNICNESVEDNNAITCSVGESQGPSVSMDSELPYHGMLRCQLCPYETKYAGQIALHLESHAEQIKTAAPDDSKSYKCTKSACSYVTNSIQDMFSHAGNCGIKTSSCQPQPHNAQFPKEPVSGIDAYLAHDGIVEDVVDATETSNLDEILQDTLVKCSKDAQLIGPQDQNILMDNSLPNNGILKCKVCPFETKFVGQMTPHLESHAEQIKTVFPDDSKTYKCAKIGCGYVTKNMKDMFSHKLVCGINSNTGLVHEDNPEATESATKTSPGFNPSVVIINDVRPEERLQ